MAHRNGHSQRDAQLRAAAETRLSGAPAPAAQHSAQELLHELQVHQIELEMQNEALRKAQIALEESRDRYVNLYEFAPVGYLTLTDKGLIAEANLTAAGMLGIERGKLLQRRFSSFVAAEDHSRFQIAFAGALRLGERHASELLLRHGSGPFFPVHLDCLCATDGEESKVLRVTLTDVSELKRAEEDIRQVNERLEAASRELESFSYSVSHDLRAPLRALNGFSQILAEEYADRLDEAGLQHLQRIRAASDRLGRLIDDMIDLSRINRQDIRKVDVNLSALAEEVFAELHAKQPLRRVAWRVAPDLAARADPQLAKLLLDNLLSNAWKFTAEQAEAQIELGRAHISGEEAFFVKDNGAGFDMGYAGKLFKPFQRLHSAERFEGTGIGLAIVHRIAQRHGGRVWAEGSPGKGATFWFAL
jgi:PAS domain S-box-containing protein